MRKIQYNAPVILTFAIISGIALLMGQFTDGRTTQQFFSVYQSSWLNPLTYIRLFGHVFGHIDFAHYAGNMMMILVLGPMVEERHGSRNTGLLIAITALVTGLLHCFLSPGTALLGASGIVFMLIFLASLAGMQKNRIPLTLLLVAVLYFGQEISAGLLNGDNISQLTHIIGGACGVVLGLFLRKR